MACPARGPAKRRGGISEGSAFCSAVGCQPGGAAVCADIDIYYAHSSAISFAKALAAADGEKSWLRNSREKARNSASLARKVGIDTLPLVRHTGLTMKTASVRDLRNRFPRVAAWVAEGERVEITRAGKVVAFLVPPATANPPKLVKPDIMAQLKKTWGDRVFSAEEVAGMRAAEREGDRG